MSGSRRPLLAAIICLVLTRGVGADDRREELWAAVRGGEAARVEELLKKGARVDATNEIGITALWLAASKGDLDVVKLLLKHGADVNTRDAIWYQTPLSYASVLGKRELVKVLLQAGARGADEALLGAVARSQLPLVEVVLDNAKVRPETLSVALHLAPSGAKEVAERLKKAGATELKKLTQEERDALKPYAGRYVNEHNTTLAVEVSEVGLVTRSLLRTGSVLTPAGKDACRPLGVDGATFRFERKGEQAQGFVMTRYTAEVSYYREDTKPVAKPIGAPVEAGEVRITAPAEWPSFRGEGASGVADGPHPPTTWDVKKEVNLRWKTPIPGLAHSCPVVWGDHVLVTTAISGDPEAKVRIGNYGDVDSVDDKTKHTWQVFCLDRETGKVRWKKTAFEGVPKIKRHQKGSQANCTPATDGKRVVACFGSEGLYCYDMEGQLVWKRDLGTLDSSFTIVKQYEWGFGSSPIIHDGLVILQCDLSKDSFIAAYSLEDGE